MEALIRKPIKELLDELDPQLFWQVHRSVLVNSRCIVPSIALGLVVSRGSPGAASFNSGSMRSNRVTVSR